MTPDIRESTPGSLLTRAVMMCRLCLDSEEDNVCVGVQTILIGPNEKYGWSCLERNTSHRAADKARQTAVSAVPSRNPNWCTYLELAEYCITGY